jgi:hypothetical protein
MIKAVLRNSSVLPSRNSKQLKRKHKRLYDYKAVRKPPIKTALLLNEEHASNTQSVKNPWVPLCVVENRVGFNLHGTCKLGSILSI